MPIDPDFLELMPHEIVVTRISTSTPYTQYGAKQFATGTSKVRCRVVQKSRLVRTADGREVFARGKVYLYGDPGITNEDKITLPDGTTPEIVFIESYPDDQGDHHQVLHYQ